MIIASITSLFVRRCRALKHSCIPTRLPLFRCVDAVQREVGGTADLAMFHLSFISAQHLGILAKYIVRELLLLMLRRLLHLGDLNLLVVLNLNSRYRNDG